MEPATSTSIMQLPAGAAPATSSATGTSSLVLRQRQHRDLDRGQAGVRGAAPCASRPCRPPLAPPPRRRRRGGRRAWRGRRRRPARSRTAGTGGRAPGRSSVRSSPENFAVLGEVVVGAVGDALELAPAPRVEELDVGGAGRVVRQLLGGRAGAGAAASSGMPRSMYQRNRSWHQYSYHCAPSSGGTKNSISICSNSRVRKMKLPGRDLVAERLADLRDAERRLLAGRRLHVGEVDEDALRGLGRRYATDASSSTGPT